MEKVEKKLKAFTLVELIVVITILAILGTIAFISMGGYSKNARNMKRINDLENIVKSLDLFYTSRGFYPDPSSSFTVTYSGMLAWNQGTFGDTTFQFVEKMNKKPVDPLTGNEYTYSTTNTKQEFQVGAITEPSSFLVMNQTYAAGEGGIASALVRGNYNGKVVKTSSGNTNYFLGVPSILTSEINNVDISTIIANKSFVYNGKQNLPSSYKNSQFVSNSGSFLYTPNKFIVYQGSIDDLQNNEYDRLVFVKNIQDNYSGTVLQNDTEILGLNSISVSTILPTTLAVNHSTNIVENILGIKVRNNSGIVINGISKNTNLYNLADSDLKNIFNNDSYYTKNWTTNNCNPNNINVVLATGGTFGVSTIPTNTILKIPNGTYSISTGSIAMLSCSAIIGESKNGVVINLPSSGFISGFSESNNSIINNISMNGNKNNSGMFLLYLLNNSTVSNVSIYGAGSNMYAIFSPFGGNNFIDRIETYDNNGSAIRVNGNKNLISNIKIYNSGFSNPIKAGISIGGQGNILNNIMAYNNNYQNADGGVIQLYGFAGSTKNSINNVQSFNNIYEGLKIEGTTNNLINNYYAYNNGGQGINIETYSSLNMVNIFNDIYLYNNSNGVYGFSYDNSTNTYFGDAKIFGNITKDINLTGTITFSGGTSDPTGLGLKNGTLDTSGSMLCDYHSQPDTLSSWGTNCTTRGVRTSGVANPNTNYVFGSKIGLQKKPIRWNLSTGNWEYYGTNGIDYDSFKTIGDW